MTVRIWPLGPGGESRTAAQLQNSLLESQPQLNHPDIALEIVSDVYLPERQIDIVVLFHDKRSEKELFKTRDGTPVHSFVLVIEVKNHSPDNVRFQGSSLSVCYDGRWSNATYQCDQQTYAFKNFQASSWKGDEKRRAVFVQRAIWLTRTPKSAMPHLPNEGSVPVHFQELSWDDLVAALVSNHGKQSSADGQMIRAFFDSEEYHSLETLTSKLTDEIVPTYLDLLRIDTLTKKRFDDQKYVEKLGTQLLIFRGRGGTGKTVTLLQLGLFQAKRGKKGVLITYNHGLISDITRSLYLVGQSEPGLGELPRVQTRYSFIQDAFVNEFGPDAEAELKRDVPLDFREEIRTDSLLQAQDLWSEFDYALIDEGQDWQPKQKELIYKIFGPDRVVVADGVDQFVGADRCSWDLRDKSRHQIVSLTASLRTKGATCQIVSEIARKLGVKGWDLVPDPDIHGGKLTVLVEAHAKSAVSHCLQLIDQCVAGSKDIQPCDNLVCLPSSKMSGGVNYEWLFDQAIKTQGRNSWRGFDEDDRRQYYREHDQLKAVRYNSCRGMEGWMSICLGLDAFFDFQIRNPRIDRDEIERDIRARDGFLASDEKIEDEIKKRAKEFAVNWMMIPLTRSIDHLVIHVTNENSTLSQILKAVSDENPGAVQWIYGKSALKELQ